MTENDTTSGGPARGSEVPIWGAVPLRAALALIAVEVASWVLYAGGVTWPTAGWVPLSPTAAAGLVAMWVWRRANTDGGTAPKVAYGVAVFCLYVVAAVALFDSAAVAVGLLASAAGEEAVFRVALPAAICAALCAVGVQRRISAVAGFAVAAAVFAYMPGHVLQAGSTGQLPWFALATMWSLMLWWRMPLWVPWLSHAALNSAAAIMGAGGSTWWWPVTLAVPLLTLTAHTGRNDRQERIAAEAAAAPVAATDGALDAGPEAA